MIDQNEIRDVREYKQRLTNFSNEFDPGLFLFILRKSLIGVFLCLFIAIAGAFIYLRYTQVVYQATSVIQLAEDDNATKILKVESYNEEGGVDAKLEQLRSKLLIGRTIQKLPLRVSYFAKGQILTSEHYQYSPYKVELLELINPDIQDKRIDISFSGQGKYDVSYNGRSFNDLIVNQDIVTPDFSIRVVVENWDELKKNEDEYELYFIINSNLSLTNRFYRALDVRILNKTAKTLELDFKDNNPYIARDFIRAHANEFIVYDLEKRRKSDDNILFFLNEQIDTVYERLKESEISLNNYKQNNKITNLETVSDVYLDRLTHYEGQVAQLDIEKSILDEVENLTRKNSSEVEVSNLIPLIAGSAYEESLSKQLDKLYQLLSDREAQLYDVTPQSDRIKSIEFQIDIQKRMILQSIEALRDQLKNKRRNLMEKLGQTENTYYSMPQKELEYARLQRLFTINEKYYTMLLEKAIEYRISKEGFVSNNQILDEVRVPSTPVSPKRKMVWLTFLLGSFLISFGIIAVRYLVHNNITSLNEVVKISDASISALGIIPTFKDDIPVSMLIVHLNPRSLIAEAFRSIRTNMQFINNSPGSKVIAITSTISGEGKTFVALNLAGIIAFSGKQVVVCDLDMRKPKIHRGFSVENNEGMSTLLIGKGKLEDTIRKSAMENLDFITAGPIPPNPSELIISNRMEELLVELKERYEVVILDTPPVGLVTDAVSLLQKADYPIYVFRSDFSKKPFVQVADKLINENHIQLSVILNGVDIDRNKYSYNYSYGYGYGYGYRYGGGSGYYDEQNRKNMRRNSWFGLRKRK